MRPKIKKLRLCMNESERESEWGDYSWKSANERDFVNEWECKWVVEWEIVNKGVQMRDSMNEYKWKRLHEWECANE